MPSIESTYDASNIVKRQAGSYGGYGHSGHGGYSDCDNGISIGLLLTAALGIGVGFMTLITKLNAIAAAAGGRKKRSYDSSNDIEAIFDQLHEVLYGGTI